MENMQEKDIQERAFKFLSALTQMAPWIKQEYRLLAKEIKDVEFVREVYMCACDLISPKEVERLIKQPGTTAVEIRKYRYSVLIANYADVLNENVEPQEEEVNQGEEFPQEAFPDTEQKPEEETVLHPESKPQIMDDTKTLGKKKQTGKMFRKLFQGSPSKLIADLYKKGVTEEQMTFIMICLEEGVSMRKIKRFAIPGVPVPIMNKLKDYYCKED